MFVFLNAKLVTMSLERRGLAFRGRGGAFLSLAFGGKYFSQIGPYSAKLPLKRGGRVLQHSNQALNAHF